MRSDPINSTIDGTRSSQVAPPTKIAAAIENPNPEILAAKEKHVAAQKPDNETSFDRGP